MAVQWLYITLLGEADRGRGRADLFYLLALEDDDSDDDRAKCEDTENTS